MRTLIKLLQILIYLSISPFVWGQLSINMPIERAVFQQVNNKGIIQIGGNTAVFIEQLQARLVVRQGGSAINWTTISTNIKPGSFRAQVTNVNSGWYELELRGLTNGNQVGFYEVQRVGIGEVFIIAGQSNAQGGRNNSDYATQIYYGANDDRVNGIDFSTDDPNQNYPFPTISKIAAETDIAPKGKASWCWALLGDELASNWNVPVLIFNTAVGATTAADWSNSANNNTEPFIYMKKTMEYYAKIFGVRAVLWHQGESDIFGFQDNYPQSCDNYKANILNTINKSRDALGANVPWVIAKVSRYADYVIPELISCQQSIISTPNANCFEGPATDQIQPGGAFRDGTLHFSGSNNGFIDLADVWFNALNMPNFKNNATPIPATNNLKVEAGQYIFGNSLAPCIGTNQSLNSGDWNNPSTWACGAVPTSLNDIIINTGHVVTISNSTVYAKNLTINGALNFENGGNLIMCNY